VLNNGKLRAALGESVPPWQEGLARYLELRRAWRAEGRDRADAAADAARGRKT
jgi:hypothetical protein